MIRVLIVDDERPARDGLRLRLERHADFEVVGEAASGLEAIAAVARHAPDLVFLDIRMPDLNGFEVLQRIPAARRPRVVFVSAYDRHALKAFEVHALDYLLKPIAARRFDEALERARAAHAQRIASRTLEALARDLRGESAGPPAAGGDRLERITVRDGAHFKVVPVRSIQWVEACGNYVTIHAGGKGMLHRCTLSELAGQLPAAGFARIHRGTLVNVEEVAEIRPRSHGDFDVLLRGGATLRMSRRYREALL